MEESVRILFVDATDGGEENAGLLADERDAFDVIHAERGSAVLDRIREERIDCLVSAYELPETDGVELLRDVREFDPAVPYVLFPEDGTEAVASEAFVAGATGYLRRGDGQLGVLADRIEEIVAGPGHSPSESEYHTLVELSPVPMLVVDRDLDVLYANPSAGDVIADGDAETLLGEPAVRLVPTEDHEASLSRLEQVFETREPAEVREYRYLTLDGETRYARGTIVPVTFEGIAAAQIVLEDITDRKQREERLQKRREQIERLHDVGVELAGCESPQTVYERTVEAAEDILALDMCLIGVVEDGRITLGASSTEISDENYIEPPVDSEEAGITGKAYRRNESYLIHDVTEHPDANPVQDYRSCIMTPLGEFGTFQAVSYEVGAFSETEMELVEILVRHAREALTRLEHEKRLREQRDQLTRENERLEEFASIISHDLRNPLNVVKGRLNHLQEQIDSEHIDVVLQSAERMDTLITDLLTLARQGETVSEYDSVELAELAESCWENVETDAATLEVDSELVVRADANRTQELLENLVRNAVEHGSTSPPSQTRADAEGYGSASSRGQGDDSVEYSTGSDGLTITIGHLPDGTGFYVEDDGPGIPPDIQDKVFDSGYTTSDDGTGFGLAIVNRIAEAHGWDISVTDGTAGGARFEITDVETDPV